MIVKPIVVASLLISMSGARREVPGQLLARGAEFVQIQHVGAENHPVHSLVLVPNRAAIPVYPTLISRYFVIPHNILEDALTYVSDFSKGEKRPGDGRTGTLYVRWRKRGAQGAYFVRPPNSCPFLSGLGNVDSMRSSQDAVKSFIEILRENMVYLDCSNSS